MQAHFWHLICFNILQLCRLCTLFAILDIFALNLVLIQNLDLKIDAETAPSKSDIWDEFIE